LADAEVITYVAPSSNIYIKKYVTIFNKEADIHERMVKALNHLATFCEKKNEAF